jgi:hypothetical protein
MEDVCVFVELDLELVVPVIEEIEGGVFDEDGMGLRVLEPVEVWPVIGELKVLVEGLLSEDDIDVAMVGFVVPTTVFEDELPDGGN